MKIRREALMGLAQLYKAAWNNNDTDTIERLSWVKQRVLYSYYQQLNDDKILVERAFQGHLVPYNLDVPEKARRLYILYATVDERAIK